MSHDPLLRVMRAGREIDAQAFGPAERDARAALREKQLLAGYFKPGLALRGHALLGLALEGQGRLDEAREAAHPACGPSSVSQVVRILRAQGLCD